MAAIQCNAMIKYETENQGKSSTPNTFLRCIFHWHEYAWNITTVNVNAKRAQRHRLFTGIKHLLAEWRIFHNSKAKQEFNKHLSRAHCTLAQLQIALHLLCRFGFALSSFAWERIAIHYIKVMSNVIKFPVIEILTQ